AEEEEIEETEEAEEEEIEEEETQDISQEEVMEIFSDVRGLGSQKAEILYENGYRSLEDLKEASQEELQGIKGIGPALSEMIKESLEELDQN
ncbi:MAG: helix-hairpin-helix domain-containing protein, partial [Candidatus Thermoplasmatota archaeon]